MPHDDGTLTYLELMENIDSTLAALLRHVSEPTPRMVEHVNALRERRQQ